MELERWKGKRSFSLLSNRDKDTTPPVSRHTLRWARRRRHAADQRELDTDKFHSVNALDPYASRARRAIVRHRHAPILLCGIYTSFIPSNSISLDSTDGDGARAAPVSGLPGGPGLRVS